MLRFDQLQVAHEAILKCLDTMPSYDIHTDNGWPGEFITLLADARVKLEEAFEFTEISLHELAERNKEDSLSPEAEVIYNFTPYSATID